MAANRRASGILVEAPRSSAAVAAAARARTILLSWPVLLAAILALALGLRLYHLDWDHGHHLHPDERFISIVDSGTKWPSFGAYFDTQHSPLNPNQGASYSYGTFPLFLGKAVADVTGHSGFDDSYLVGRTLTALFDTGTVLLVFAIGSLLWSRRVGLLAALLSALTVLQIQLAHFWTVDPYLTFFSHRNALPLDQDRPLGWRGQLSPLRRCDRPRAREQGDCTDTGRAAGCGGRAAGGHFGPRQPDCGADQLPAGKGHPRARRLRGGRIRRVSGRPAVRLHGPAHLGHRTGRTVPRRPARATSPDQRQRRLSAVRPVGAPPELRLSAREHPLLGARGSAGARGDRGRRLRGLPSLPRRRYETGSAPRAGRQRSRRLRRAVRGLRPLFRACLPGARPAGRSRTRPSVGAEAKTSPSDARPRRPGRSRPDGRVGLRLPARVPSSAHPHRRLALDLRPRAARARGSCRRAGTTGFPSASAAQTTPRSTALRPSIRIRSTPARK